MLITLHLKKHCIETAAKNRYEMLIKQYFSSHKTSSKEEQEKIEIEIEQLLLFLENADFEDLRHRYPKLSGIDDICVCIDSINGHIQGIFLKVQNKLEPI